jgi:hypothetical protein
MIRPWEFTPSHLYDFDYLYDPHTSAPRTHDLDNPQDFPTPPG